MCVTCNDKRSLMRKIEKLGFGHNGSAANQHTETAAATAHRFVQRCLLCIFHACQCRNTNCQRIECEKTKVRIQHLRSCKHKPKMDCRLCKLMTMLSICHARRCQKENCPFPLCITMKYKLKRCQLQRKIREAQNLERRIAVMQNRSMSGAALRSRPGNSSSSSEQYPRAQQQLSPHYPSETGIGIITPAAPPVGSLQAVQQVQAPVDEETDSVLEMLLNYPDCTHEENFDISDDDDLPHPNPEPLSLPQMDMRQTTDLGEGSGAITNSVGNSVMESYPQVMRSSSPSHGGPGERWQQLLQALRSTPSEEKTQQLLTTLKSDPQLKAALINYRAAQQQQQQQQ